MFEKTTVHCSHPGCHSEATTKIASPWTYRQFAELKTYGFACPAHIDAVLDAAHDRSTSVQVSEGEKVGTISTYEIVYC
jgi:hypothetical protein